VLFQGYGSYYLKGHITFGMVSSQKMVTAARPETVSFNQLHKTDHSRGSRCFSAATEARPA
jgi:non-homologous end joining protein Ku